MDYDQPMTSPTELLSPQAFPDTDLNGNAAMCRSNDVIDYRAVNRSCCRKSRCLIIALVIFIIVSLVMAGLFAWRMIAFKSTSNSSTSKPPPECFLRVVPVKFEKLPQTIENFLRDMKNKMKSTMEKDGSSVALMNVVYYDKVIWEAKFESRNNKVQDAIKSKAFPVASVTKVITSLLAFKLHNDGNIASLDDPITNYEPNFRINNPSGNSNEVTVHQLISYLSGLPREAPCYPDNNASFCPYNNSDVLRKLNNSNLLFDPGTDILYGNLQFGLVGQAMGRNYSGGYRKLVHDQIFAPLGMDTSFFALNDSVKKDMYKPHLINNKIPILKEWGWIDPAGGLLTTIDDLAKLEIALFNNTESHFLRSSVYEDFFAPVYFFQDEKTMIGSPWVMEFQKGYLTYSKGGYAYGYASSILLVPHLRLAVNVLTTSKLLSSQLDIPKLVDLFHDELEKVSENMRATPVANAERFLGIYYTNDVITLANKDTVIMKSPTVAGNSTHQVLAIQLDSFIFDMAYIGDNVFEIIHKQCSTWVLGINREKVYFEELTHKKLTQFVIYGIHLRGRATFYRKN